MYDPVGETYAMLDTDRFHLVSVTDALPDEGLLIIGRHVLEDKNRVRQLAQLGFDEKELED